MDEFVDRECDVPIYRLDRMRHKPAFATELSAERVDVRLKKIDLRLKFSAYSGNQVIHASGVIRGVPAVSLDCHTSLYWFIVLCIEAMRVRKTDDVVWKT